MYFPYFSQDLESKKKVVWILAHVWWGGHGEGTWLRNNPGTVYDT